MNDLFTRSWTPFKQLPKETPEEQDVEMAMSHSQVFATENMGGFQQKVRAIEQDLKNAAQLLSRLEATHEKAKSLVKAAEVKSAQQSMQGDMRLMTGVAAQTKKKLEELQRENAENRAVAGCEVGSAVERSRSNITRGLAGRLRETVQRAAALRQRVDADEREALRRRVFAVTGAEPAEEDVVAMAAAGEGESERVFELAVRRQGGRGAAEAALAEVRERSAGAQEVARSLLELHDLFLQMATLVEAQGEAVDDIQANVEGALAYQTKATAHLGTAVAIQRNTRKWKLYGALIVLVIIAILALVIWLAVK